MNAHQFARGPRLPGIYALILAAVLAACTKSEAPAPNRAAAPAPPAPSPAASAPDGAPATQADDKLLERLARQEAAARLFDPRKPEPAPGPAPKPEPAPKAAERASPAPTPATATAAAPAASATTVATKAPITAIAARPPAPEAPPKAATPVPVPQPAAAKAAPPATKAAPPAAPAPSRLVSRVNPEFPREAVKEGYDRGSVKARMTLDAEGNVTKVDVLESNPRRVFDRAVTRALSQWKFSAGAAGRAVETEIEFTR